MCTNLQSVIFDQISHIYEDPCHRKLFPDQNSEVDYENIFYCLSLLS